MILPPPSFLGARQRWRTAMCSLHRLLHLQRPASERGVLCLGNGGGSSALRDGCRRNRRIRHARCRRVRCKGTLSLSLFPGHFPCGLLHLPLPPDHLATIPRAISLSLFKTILYFSTGQHKLTISISNTWPKGTRCRVGPQRLNRSSYRQYMQQQQTQIFIAVSIASAQVLHQYLFSPLIRTTFLPGRHGR